ncbi:beta-galactosidase trimerization domain-containing protein [Streptomyces sp. NBC_00572]|nr:beta-galactosidase trimerization domain-containing protein [Streptomyces sp. NBC_00572]
MALGDGPARRPGLPPLPGGHDRRGEHRPPRRARGLHRPFEVAVLHDSDVWWALEVDGLPSAGLDYHSTLRRAYRALWDAGVTVDFPTPSTTWAATGSSSPRPCPCSPTRAPRTCAAT